MRFAVFVFSVLLIFSTTYAYAVAWVPAAVGGIVNMGGKFLKVANKKGLLGHSATWVAGYCTANKKKCLEALGEVGDLAEDWLEDPNTDTSQVFYISTNNDCTGVYTHQTFDACLGDFAKNLAKINHPSFNVTLVKTNVPKVTKDDRNYCISTISKNGHRFSHVQTIGNRVEVYQDKLFFTSHIWNGQAVVYCGQDETKDKEYTEEQIQKIINNLSETEINTVINNYGDQIDIDKYCQESGSCDELSKEFGDEVTKNQNKYDIDKINKANCLVENGKIVSCDNAKLEIEEENENEDEDEDEKTFCDTSDLTKEICEYLDWVDDEPEEKEDQKVEVEDEEEKPLDDDIIDVDKTCPPPEEIHITMPWGYATTVVFDYKPYCDFAEKINPYMVATGGLMAMYTVAGVRRF